MNHEIQPIELNPDNSLALAAAAVIGREAYSVPSRTLPQDIVRCFNEQGKICVGVVEDDSVIGAGVMSPPSEISTSLASLSYIAVEPEMRRQGVGAAVLTELEKQAVDLGAKAMSLCALPRAVPFYKEMGYKSYDPDLPQHMSKLLPQIENS